MGTNDQDVASLWARSVAGDDRAFRELFRQHRDRVFRHCLAQLAHAEDAEDTTAMAFFELWRLRDKVHVVNGSVLPWLLVTATNLSRNSRRARSRYETALRQMSQVTDGTPSAEEQASASLPIETINPALANLLARLPTRENQVLTLTALEGLRAEEAAQVMGLSATTARSHLHRARRRLRNDDPSLRALLEGTNR